MKMTDWTKKDIEYLTKNYDKYSIRFISKELNRSENSIRLKMNRLGLKFDKKISTNDINTETIYISKMDSNTWSDIVKSAEEKRKELDIPKLGIGAFICMKWRERNEH